MITLRALCSSKPVTHLSRTITILKESLAPLNWFAKSRRCFLAAEVRLPLGTVFGAAGHHDFQRLRLPLQAQLDQRLAKVRADAPTHEDNRSEPEMDRSEATCPKGATGG